MAAAVQVPDLVRGGRAWLDSTGYHATRIFHVTGLTSTTGPLLQALVGVTGLPAYAEPHPDYPLIFATDFQTQPWAESSRTEAKVVITYNGPTGNNTADTVITWAGHTQEARTNFRDDGTVIKTTYVKDGKEFKEIGLVTGVRSCGVLTFDFTTPTDPENQYAFLGGGVNSNPWRGGNRWTWMFENPVIQKAKFIPGWRVSLSARYDPQTHLKTSFFRDVHGFIPEDIDDPVIDRNVSGNGFNTVLPFGMFPLNFNNVILPGV